MGEVEDVMVGEGLCRRRSLCTLLFLLDCTRIGFVQSPSYFGIGYLVILHCAIVDVFKSLSKVRAALCSYDARPSVRRDEQ